MTHTIEHHGRVVLVRLNRPEVLNALNGQLLRDLVPELVELDASDEVGCKEYSAFQARR